MHTVLELVKNISTFQIRTTIKLEKPFTSFIFDACRLKLYFVFRYINPIYKTYIKMIDLLEQAFYSIE